MEFQTIGKLLQGYFAIPDYQRDYEWTTVQITTLIDDIMAIVTNETQNHFIGAIVTIPFEIDSAVSKSLDFDDYNITDSQVKHVVDGQQRLISCTVLISCILQSLEEDNFISPNEKKAQTRILDSILYGSDYNDNSEPAPKLILNGNTGNCYNNFILKKNTTGYDQRYKGAKRLLDAHKLFKDEICKKKNEFLSSGIFASEIQFYKALIKAITDKIKFVEVACDKSADAFQVFDSLNGKGLDLTAADRIKNILLSWTPANKEGLKKWETLEREVGEKHLSSFFVATFFLHNGKRVSQGKLPDEFKAKFKNIATTNNQGFWDNLHQSAKLYGRLRMANVKKDEVKSHLRDIQDLGQEQIYALLFSVVEFYGEELIERKEFADFLEASIAILVRMQVCGKSMNRLDAYFTKWITLMKEKNEVKCISDLTKKICLEKESIVDSTVFETMFVNFAPNNSKIDSFYLRHIESYLRKKEGNRSTPRAEEVTIEHIVPQTLSDSADWFGKGPLSFEIVSDFKSFVERIGNKVLLYGDDNTSAGNDCYQEKIVVYKNGKQSQDKGTPVETFCLIKELLQDNPDTFDYDAVLARAKKLAGYAKEIW